MDDKDINNIHAWRMFQKGKVSPDDLKLAFKIHKYLIQKKNKKESYVTTFRNMLLDVLIKTEKIQKNAAYLAVADIENVDKDTIRKPYNEWEKMSEVERNNEIKRYLKDRSNFIDQGDSDAMTTRINRVLKKRGF